MKRTNSFAARNLRTAAEEGEAVTMGKTQSGSRKKCKAQPMGEFIAPPEGETGEGHWSARIQRSGGKPWAARASGSVSRRSRNRQTAVRWQTSIPDKARKGRPDNSKVVKSQLKTIITTHFTENIAEKSSRAGKYCSLY